MRTVTRPDDHRHTAARPRALALAAAALTALVLAPVRSPHAAATPAAATPAAATPAATTPNGCIAVNGGDWNACNVGHHGRGGQPYAQHHARAVPGTARSTTTS
jgi:hypothetical protein